MRHDMLADVFVIMKNAERIGKRSCIVPSSKITKEILKIMQKNKYIGSFEFIEDGKSGKFKVELVGKINNCGVIRPRFEVKKGEFIRWEKRFLPSVSIGLLFLTTSRGVLDHRQAKKEDIGGGLLGFIY
ncbi:MAG: 30S ribosomal protein S8 [Candidatus Aenigmarchaeota archaeon]|nr:30S ribosomal protein S8 [Candidatus Aenigmarchaeota archaeon]NIP41012.1 30S ribosomal protein S8 [Candidatus Aenigmarchaeota archaeon]NIQ17414.1 30S ribosomal protein S8 [Candidatus Aenigmarchaeota archaeon]NIS73608.1 30S ribosomal protein S8 [Candidatus Aenigmarchaeota archaeon]